MPTPQAGPAVATSLWSMYRAIVGIGLLCALLIVTVYQATAERIRSNEEQALKRAVANVMPAAVRRLAVTVGADGRLQAAADEPQPMPAFLGYDLQGELIGAAITAAGMGYQDTIRIIYGYVFDRQAIMGMGVLESKETPGLGDKIETDPDFLRNFEALDVRLTADGTGLANPIVTVSHGEKSSPWEIDAITGATISSEAIGEILDRSARQWVPALKRDAATLAPPSGPGSL